MAVEKKAVTELRKGLKKFREDALKHGWEEDEIETKIAEVYENFPWYKYDPPKKSCKSKLFNFLLYSFIVYLAVGAVLERNRRWKKRVDDFIFDSQISYHSQRVIRILTLPLFKVHDLSQYHENECLIYNPFKKEDDPDCSYCEGISSMPSLPIDGADVDTMISESEPLILIDVPGYADCKIGFDDFQKIFKENTKDLDDAVCNIKRNTVEKMSTFFEETDEKKMVQQNLSIEWSNCHTYGTRFYRKLFTRPSFVAKESEIHIEKRVYMLQKDLNSTLHQSEGRTHYLYQSQGESEIELSLPTSCHHNCTSEPIKATLKTGCVAVIPNTGWNISFKTLSDGLNILFLSTFT